MACFASASVSAVAITGRPRERRAATRPGRANSAEAPPAFAWAASSAFWTATMRGRLAWRSMVREGGSSAVCSRKATPASRAAAMTLSALSRSPRRSRPDLAAFAHGGPQFLQSLPELGGIGKGFGAGQGPAASPEEGGLEIQRTGSLPALEGGQGRGVEKGLGHAWLRGSGNGLSPKDYCEANTPVTEFNLPTLGQKP